MKNFAYIDGNNLYRGIADSKWKIDFFRFRKWLSDKYGIVRAYYFIGLIPKQKDMYTALLKRTNAKITYLNDVKNKIRLKRKSPHQAQVLTGSFS